ncbi:MAG: amino acid ABC transporter permease [Rhodospirillales bacterium]|nr:amino acid ABC transporter permease [Rhodospirillales bacterium]
MNYRWDWGILLKDPYFSWIASGFGWTCAVAILAWIIALSLGSVIGVMRTLPHPVPRAIGTAYVELFRNIPLLVQLFLWYFVVPEVLPREAGMFLKRGLPMPEFWTAVVCLGFYTGARVAEQVRAGINAIRSGQRQAALAMGLTLTQVYRYVLVPVSYRIIIPPLTSDFLGVFKNSSLALTIGVAELTARSRQIEEYTFQGIEAFATATVLYSVVTFAVMALMHMTEKRTRIPGLISLEAK